MTTAVAVEVRNRTAILMAALLWSAPAKSDELRVHVTGAGAHAIGGTQEREFGAGGGGGATVELAVGNVLGLQASGSAVVLSTGAAPIDGSIAKQSTGSAFLGTVGVRYRPLGGYRVAGPWIDANGGLAQTGNQERIALDAHIGWDFRVSQRARWDVGPFIGFTQIMQDAKFRPDDAHIAWAGIQLSLGASEKKQAAPALPNDAPAEPTIHDVDGVAEAFDVCPPVDEYGMVPDGCPSPEVKLVGDRIVLDDVIHFEFNSPVIRRSSFGLVKKVAQLLTQNEGILEVSIEGHADARGTEQYNQHLSEERATSTRDLLVHFGVEESRLRVVGFGKSRLKVPTTRADVRNRRVEFIVSRSVAAVGPPPAQRSTPKVASGKRSSP